MKNIKTPSILTLLLLLTFVTSGYLAFQNYQLKQQITQPVTNWKTFSNDELSFKYPANWTLQNNRIIGTSPNVVISIATKNSTLMNECMQLKGVGISPGQVVKKYISATIGEMCQGPDPDIVELWIVPTEEAYSPGINYRYSTKDNPAAENIYNQIHSTFKFIQ